jgi:hypothetical protein
LFVFPGGCEIRRFFRGVLSKIALKMAMAWMKLLWNKKEAQVRQMQREVAQLLEGNQDQTARIRVRTPSFNHPQQLVRFIPI